MAKTTSQFRDSELNSDHSWASHLLGRRAVDNPEDFSPRGAMIATDTSG